MNDNNLLALAAKASGRRISNRTTDGGLMVCIDERRAPHKWNPLADDGDAFRLQVKLELIVGVHYDCSQPLPWLRVEDRLGNWTYAMTDEYGADLYAATRRAIVQAAAKLGATL